MPTVITQGAASAKGYGFGASSAAVNYIEDVFSTWLYTGTGANQTITNGIDLSTKGGMVWIKSRSDATDNFLFDTARGVQKEINSNTTDAEVALPYSLGPFNTNGFTIGNATGIGVGAATYASWTFRKQPKFFDVVTYTGNGTTQNISHNLGSAPGCIFVKATSSGTNWCVYHRSVGNTGGLILNTTNTTITDSGFWNNTSPTSTQFTVGSGSAINVNSVTYVAYLFAHDAGGFGATGSDNVISCGSYTGTGNTSLNVNLGYEPQWIMVKSSTSNPYSNGWYIQDNMRGMTASTSNNGVLYANLADAEIQRANHITATATGFTCSNSELDFNGNGVTYIYIAIRRGPMKTPTTGTSVFGLNARNGTNANATVTGGQTDDAALIKVRNFSEVDLFASRLTGTGYLVTSSTAAEVAADSTILQANPWDVMDGVKVGTTSLITNSSSYGGTYINYLFKRAPGFFDVVCYTGNGDNTNGITISHNLGVAPQVIICKRRSAVADWYTSWAPILGYGTNNEGYLNTTASFINGGKLANAPTATTFKWTDASGLINASGSTYVAYLFATVAGVSKVGSYTGTAALQTINCGFTGGARFVLIKRTDSTGDWYVWDSARGISSGNDPYLLLNSTAAEVTGTNYVDTTSTGFQVTAAAPAALNANGGSYIFLAIA